MTISSFKRTCMSEFEKVFLFVGLFIIIFISGAIGLAVYCNTNEQETIRKCIATIPKDVNWTEAVSICIGDNKNSDRWK